MRLTSFLRLIIGVTMVCMSALPSAQTYLRPFPSNHPHAFGYINSVGIFVIPPIFWAASHFSAEGIAHVVDQDRKHGYIDMAGKYVIAPRFDDLEDPYRPDAPMRVAFGKIAEAKYGFIDTKGELVVPAIYDGAYVFRNGFAHITVGPYAQGTKNRRHGFVDTQGNLAVPAKFEDARSFGSNGLAAVRVGEHWGFINIKGEIAIEPMFDDVQNSPESVFNSFGIAPVKRGNQWILIDANGKQVGHAEGDSIGEFNEDGLAVIGQGQMLYGRRAGVINTKGEYVFKPQFDRFLGYKNGFAQVSIDNKWGYIDSRGNIVVAPRFPFYGTDFNEVGIAQVVLEIRSKPDNRITGIELVYGYINTTGQLILREGQYDGIGPFDAEGFAVVRKGDKRGFVNKDGKEAVGWFDDAGSFSRAGLAAVKQGRDWGYVDKSGNMVIRPRFDRAFTFSTEGIALIELNKKFGHINIRGEFITQPIYEKLSPFGRDDLASATLNGVSGFVDKAGKFAALPPSTP